MASTVRTMLRPVEMAEALLNAAQEAEQLAGQFLPGVHIQDGRGAQE
jgi:hypothetical protein